MKRAYDIVIIGTGMGGGTLAYALRDSGAHLLLLERGAFLPQEPENWSPEEVFDRRPYKPAETWLDAAGKPFHPGVHYFVGGNTKVYGAALPRLHRQDFDAMEHEGGIYEPPVSSDQRNAGGHKTAPTVLKEKTHV
jgi:choline dehydrogenase-like flavoprotein